MPRITNITQLERAMKDLQDIFLEQQNVDVSISRGKFKDWSDTGYGNKTLLFQSLYTKGIPIAELAKWLSPTQNQGQVRNAVVKINDISYVQGMIGARANAIEDFKRILNYNIGQNNNSSIANAYTGSIRYWWINRGGSEERVVRTPSRPSTPRTTRQPRITTPSEPTTTNGGTTAITQGVLDSCFHIIKANFSSIKWWASNRIVSQTPGELADSWDEFLTGRLLNTTNSLLTNPSLPSISQGLSFWRSQNNATKLLLQKFALIVLFDLNDFTRALTFKVLKTDTNFLISFAQRFGQQNTPARLIEDLLRRMPAFRSIMEFDGNEVRIIQRIYLGRDTQGTSRRTTPTEPTTTNGGSTASETAANTLIRNIPFTNTFGLEVEYFYPTEQKIILEGKKLGVNIKSEGYTHQVKNYWKIVTDGSVVGTNGKEIVSPILKGKKGILEMRKCLTALLNAGVLINESMGVHLHFGARDLTLQQWKNLLFNYYGFQPIIDKMLAGYRRNNKKWAMQLDSKYERDSDGNRVVRVDREWRQKVNEATSFRDLQLINMRNTNTSTNLSSEEEYRSSARYFAVNLFSYPKHGTVEFRQHGAGIEFDTLVAWLYFMHYLLEVSKKKELTNFSFNNLMNLTPVPLHSWINNRIFDLSKTNSDNESIVEKFTPYEPRN